MAIILKSGPALPMREAGCESSCEWERRVEMKVALFGATGGTGQALLRIATTRGVAVRALVRPQSSLGPDQPPTVSSVVGSLASDEDVARTLYGCDAACIVFGPRPPYREIFCADATARIIVAMRAQGIPRLVCQTGAMVGSYRSNRTWALESSTRLHQRMRPDLARDRTQQEVAVVRSGFDWTLVKPPRLTNGARSFSVVAGPDVRVGLLSSVARQDLADVLLATLLGNRYSRTVAFVRQTRTRQPAPTMQRAPHRPLEGLPKLAEEGQALGMTDAAAP